MAFFFLGLTQILEAILVEEVVAVAATATAVYVGVEVVGNVAERIGEATRSSSSPAPMTTTTLYLEQKTIYDWWGSGLVYEEHQKLLGLGYDNRSGCFTLQELREILCLADKKPGKPTKDHGWEPPSNWDGKLKKEPRGQRKGYPHKDRSVWVPTGEDPQNPNSHGGAHWDVEYPDGSHKDVFPDGRVRHQH